MKVVAQAACKRTGWGERRREIGKEEDEPFYIEKNASLSMSTEKGQ
jgi:hypothetical protein